VQETLTSFMPNSSNSQVSFFTIGLIFLFGAVVSTFTGKTLSHGVIDRNKEPRLFWWVVTVYYVAAIFFFYCHLYGQR
jgi:high-affinity Fe2+/Pb2+ permease